MAETPLMLVLDEHDTIETATEKAEALIREPRGEVALEMLRLAEQAQKPVASNEPLTLTIPAPRRGGRGAMLGVMAVAACLAGGSPRVFRTRPEPKQGNSDVDNARRAKAEAKRKRKAARRRAASPTLEDPTHG